MARKTTIITIDDEGRDKGKIFHIRELPARQAERWASRALMMLGRHGVDIEGLAGTGFAGIAVLGIQALFKAQFEEVEPLLDEMFSCVMVQPDARHPNIVRPLIDLGGEGDDIEEIATRLRLRAEVFSLHTGFSLPGANSTSSISAPTPVVSPSTSMSPPKPSGRSSHPGRRR